jgi:hypothetical protein
LKSNLNFTLWVGPTHQPCSSLFQDGPACQPPMPSVGPAHQSPLSVLVPPVSSLLTLCHMPHTSPCCHSRQGCQDMLEPHTGFQRRGQHHPPPAIVFTHCPPRQEFLSLLPLRCHLVLTSDSSPHHSSATTKPSNGCMQASRPFPTEPHHQWPLIGFQLFLILHE